MKNIIVQLRSGRFLTRERMRLWAGGFLVASILCLAFLGLTARGLNDYAGRALGTDFSNVYAAGVAVSRGDPTSPFDIQRQYQNEQAVFGPEAEIYGWHYPPYFLLVAWGLAQIPYIPALILWQGASLLLYLGSLGLLLKKTAPGLLQYRLWLLLALGFSAVLVNLLHGQNGFLTAALFASALALLDERPFVSGVLFGLLCYKPQFAVVIPLVLAVTGRWRTFGAAAATVLAATAIVTTLFGVEIWPAFAASARFLREVGLEQGETGFQKIQSVFAWVRLWGGSVTAAYALQILSTCAALFALVRIWRADTSIHDKGAALCLGALLSTPYSLDYDLMLLAPAIALLAAAGIQRGFADYEVLSLAALWLVPSIARGVALHAWLPLAVPAMAFSFLLICKRSGLWNAALGRVKITAW